MNWKRIWVGAALAGLGMFFLHFLISSIAMKATAMPLSFKTMASLGLWILPSHLVDGFFCSWLYALMRPRLGPGPKTALLVGFVIFLIKYAGSLVMMPFQLSQGILLSVGIVLLSGLKLLAGTYIAGWQYIEKSPE